MLLTLSSLVTGLMVAAATAPAVPADPSAPSCLVERDPGLRRIAAFSLTPGGISLTPAPTPPAGPVGAPADVLRFDSLATLAARAPQASFHSGGLSDEQVGVTSWVLGARLAGAMAGPSNILVPPAIEADTLPVVLRVGATSAPQSMTGFSAWKWNENDQLWVGASLGGVLELALPTLPAGGRFRLDVHATRAPDFAHVQVAIDGVPVGAPLDLYAPVVMPTGRISLGTVDLVAGDHLIRFTVVGNTPPSTGSGFGLDGFTLAP